ARAKIQAPQPRRVAAEADGFDKTAAPATLQQLVATVAQEGVRHLVENRLRAGHLHNHQVKRVHGYPSTTSHTLSFAARTRTRSPATRPSAASDSAARGRKLSVVAKRPPSSRRRLSR